MFPNYFSDEETQLFMQSIRKMVRSEFAPHIDTWEREGNFPDSVIKLLGDQGFLGILISEDFGGIGAHYRTAAAWCEAFGELRSVGLTTGVNMHALVISHALERYGSKKSKEQWLRRSVEGTAIGAYAFTEPNAGSDLANIRTRAELKDGKWVLNGSKTFITNGARADYVLVLARHDLSAGYKGFTTFCVDTSLPGFKVTRKLDKLGWRASDTAELSFENLQLDQDSVVGKVGDGWTQASNNLNWERLMLTFTSIGGAKACFADTLRYTKDRSAFGKPLIDMDIPRDLIESMYQKIVLGDALAHHALELLCQGAPCKAEVSAAKRHVCDDAVWIADRAIQLHGGYGYTTEFSAERWWRDLRLMPIGGGTSEIMARIVAKELGLNF